MQTSIRPAPSSPECSRPTCSRETTVRLLHNNDSTPRSRAPLGDGGDTPDVLTPKDICNRLHISENTCYRELKEGSLAGIAFRVGKQYRVYEPALIALLQGVPS